MSVPRLTLTAAAMSAIAGLLSALTPSLHEMAGTLSAPQLTADTSGPDALVQAAAGVLAWLVWGWGCLGLALTAGSVLPGLVGVLARLTCRVVLPAGARRGAALLLGLGLGVAAPLTGVLTTVLAVPAAAAPAYDGVPDWPAGAAASPAGAPAPTPAGPPAPTPAPAPEPTPAAPGETEPPAGVPVPDWPDPSDAPAGGSHVVLRGDCLWHIAEAHLLHVSGTPPTDREIALEVQAWWTANADVIGPDPDRLLPGQVLRPPGAA